MSRSDRQQVVLVPEWFGLEPADAYAVIADVLRGSGGRATDDGTFRLDLDAVHHLRRQGMTIRNRRTLSVTVGAATHIRDLLFQTRSHTERNRASVIAREEHIRTREELAHRVLARFAEAPGATRRGLGRLTFFGSA